MNSHYRTLAEYILKEITLQQNHSQTFMQKVSIKIVEEKFLNLFDWQLFQYADAVVTMATRYNLFQLDRLLLILVVHFYWMKMNSYSLRFQFLRPLEEAKTPYVHILFYFMVSSTGLADIIRDFTGAIKSVSSDQCSILSMNAIVFRRSLAIFGAWRISMKNFIVNITKYVGFRSIVVHRSRLIFFQKHTERFFLEGFIKDAFPPVNEILVFVRSIFSWDLHVSGRSCVANVLQ